MAGGVIAANVIGAIGAFFKGLFGLRQSQSDVVIEALKVIKDVNTSDAQKALAAAQAIQADASSESPFTRMWRPIALFYFLFLLTLWIFGYTPAALLQNEMPPIIGRIFDIIETVILAGYGRGTLDRILRNMMVGRLLNTFISKQI